jgi:5-methylcytosine-specific restriction endonuclease McrA
MANYSNLSSNELKISLKEKHKNKKIVNIDKTRKYYLNFFSKIDKKSTNEIKNKICYLIELGISARYLADFFNLKSEEIKSIAIENKINSNLFRKYKKETDYRCFSKRQIVKSCENYNFICPVCFCPLDIRHLETITGHHIIPYSQGGKTKIDNCLPLHITCHYEDFEKLHGLQKISNRIYTKKHFNIIKKMLKEDKSGIEFLLQE